MGTTNSVGNGLSGATGTGTFAGNSSGSFTPVLAFGGASTGITYSIQEGFYIRTGSLCFINIQIILTSKGSSTGNASISGLPFNTFLGGFLPMLTGNVNFLAGGGTSPFFFETGFPSATSGTIVYGDISSNVNTATDGAFANNAQISLSGVYGI